MQNQENRPGVGALQLAGLFVLIGGIGGVIVGLDALGRGFEDEASSADKWVFVVTTAVPVVVGAGLLFGLSRVIDLLYDLRDGRQVAPVVPAPPDGGPAY